MLYCLVCTTKAKFYCMTEANKAILVIRIEMDNMKRWRWVQPDNIRQISQTHNARFFLFVCFLTWSLWHDIHHAGMSQQEKWQPWVSFSGKKRDLISSLYPSSCMWVYGQMKQVDGGMELIKTFQQMALNADPTILFRWQVWNGGVRWEGVKINPDLTRCCKCWLCSRWTCWNVFYHD